MGKRGNQEIAGFIGPSGSGKSVAALSTIAKRRRQVRLDIPGQDGFAKGAVTVHTPQALIDALKAAGKAGPVKVHYQSLELRKKDHFELVNRICAAAGNLHMVWDETENLLGHTRPLDHTYRVLAQNQHLHIGLCWTSQTIKGVQKQLRENAHRVHVFRGGGDGYRKDFKNWLGQAALDTLDAAPQYSSIEVLRDGSWSLKKPFKISA